MKPKRNLSRGWRTAGNLTAALALTALALLLWGWPAWMGCWAFRHLEAQYLLTPSAVVRTNRSEDGQRTAYLSEGADWITVGQSTALRWDGLPFPKAEPCIVHLLPKEGVVLTALPAPNRDRGITVAVWGAPEEAVSGALEVDLIGVSGGVWDCPGEETVSAQNPERKGDWLFFELSCGTGHSDREMCAIDGLWEWDARILYGYVGEQPYRLVLTDGQGAEVVSRSGTLPPRQLLID